MVWTRLHVQGHVLRFDISVTDSMEQKCDVAGTFLASSVEMLPFNSMTEAMDLATPTAELPACTDDDDNNKNANALTRVRNDSGLYLRQRRRCEHL